MPPRASHLTSTFSTSNEHSKDYIECRLLNSDGAICAKRCFNEKKYRSMQEHIRRAHSEHYIPKLPATEESVEQMMTSDPHPPMNSTDTSPQQPMPGWPDPLDGITDNWADGLEGHGQEHSSYSAAAMFSPNHYRRGSLLQTTNAAAALAQLHNSRPESDWQGNQDAFGDPDNDQDYMSNYFAQDSGQDMFGDNQNSDMSFPMPNQPLERSYSGRASSTPFNRRANRPRKSSVTENARKGKHERDRSKDLKRFSADRKALSAEPNKKRWEDLLDAAQSATEEESRDLTPIPQSPRASLPPFQSHGATQFSSYTASPLQNALLTHESTDDTQTNFNSSGLEAFPSVESSYNPVASTSQPYQSHHHQSSGESAHSNRPMYPSYDTKSYDTQRNHASSTGSNFHMPTDGLSSSSPGQLSRPQTHDGNNHVNNAFTHARPATTSTPHYPHPLNAAHMAQQQAAAQQQSSNYGQPQGIWATHHASFSASASGASSAHSSLNNHRPSGGVDFNSPPVQHYCASCKQLTQLDTSFACTECICGICSECAEILKSPESRNREQGCPKCGSMQADYKSFRLDLK